MILFKNKEKKFVGRLVCWAIAIIILAAGVICIADLATRELSLALYINEERICFVEDRSVVSEALLLLDDKLDADGIVYSADNKITYRYIAVRKSRPVSVDECADLLYDYTASDYSRGFMIFVDGNELIACPSREEAEEVVKELENQMVEFLLENDGSNNTVGLVTEFEIKNVLCLKNRILNADEICKTLTENTVSTGIGPDGSSDNKIGYSFLLAPDKHIFFGFVKNELTDSQIENSFSFTINGLNSEVEYKTLVVEKYTEIIPFETVYIDSDELFAGEKLVITEGETGISENEYEVSYVDGEIASKKLISSTVHSEPVTCVVHVGTKPYPPTKPTGSFIWPLKDRIIITSPYNVIRDIYEDVNTPHLGIDIAGKMNQDIYAADGGTVIFAGEAGTYGLLVKIVHEETVMTYYAHMDSIAVKEGDKVYKGQKVGEIGMTGTSTGPHVHFEVRINGKTANPVDYLPSGNKVYYMN